VGCILAPLRGWFLGCTLAPLRGWFHCRYQSAIGPYQSAIAKNDIAPGWRDVI